MTSPRAHRFSIWCAVSTAQQATEDKVSLSEQEKKCRSLAESRNWVETAGPYIVPGESRTSTMEISVAEREIPQLKQMLDDAQAGQFDILVMWDFNRLRDLLAPVSKTLSHYRIQLYSVSQPVEPLPIETYSPYASDTSSIVQGITQIISNVQISDLRRKYSLGMPHRVARGLQATGLPWGYRRPPGRESDREAVPIQDKDKCDLLVKIKDWYLSGVSIAKIVALCEASGQKPSHAKHWSRTTIHDLLTNPFFAGQVRFGITRMHLDPRTGRRHRDRHPPADHMVTGQGKHEPLWDMQTYQAILAEKKRRKKGWVGDRNNQFTGLLECGVCGKKLWTFYDGHYGQAPPSRVWRCSSREAHVFADFDRLLMTVSHKLVKALQSRTNVSVEVDVSSDQARLAQLETERTRLEDAYQAGAFSLSSFSERVASIDSELTTLHQTAASQEFARQEAASRQAALRELAGALDAIPAYLEKGDPNQVNHELKLLISKIIVRSVEDIEIVF